MHPGVIECSPPKVIGNSFFSKWLDKSLTYSSAVYENFNDSLEQAQKNKYIDALAMVKIY